MAFCFQPTVLGSEHRVHLSLAHAGVACMGRTTFHYGLLLDPTQRTLHPLAQDLLQRPK